MNTMIHSKNLFTTRLIGNTRRTQSAEIGPQSSFEYPDTGTEVLCDFLVCFAVNSEEGNALELLAKHKSAPIFGEVPRRALVQEATQCQSVLSIQRTTIPRISQHLYKLLER